MRIITAPNHYHYNKGDIRCFLAGGITNCPDWQSEVISCLQKEENKKNGTDLSRLVIFNPRRSNFPINDPNVAEQQITWEFDHLEKCDIFSMYFCNSDSDQPICMYELGRNLLKIHRDWSDNWNSRIIVSVENGYRRQKDVEIQVNLATDSNIVVKTGATPENHAKYIITSYMNNLW